MFLDPILTAPLAIQVHLMSAGIAIILGPFALFRRRRDIWHKWLGRTWVGIMAVLAISGLLIASEIMPIVFGLGPIHVLSFAVLFWLAQGVWQIRKGDMAAHKATMQALYWQSLGFAGLLTLLPGRRLNSLLFGDRELLGLWLIAAIAAAWLLRVLWLRKTLRFGSEKA